MVNGELHRAKAFLLWWNICNAQGGFNALHVYHYIYDDDDDDDEDV